MPIYRWRNKAEEGYGRLQSLTDYLTERIDEIFRVPGWLGWAESVGTVSRGTCVPE